MCIVYNIYICHMNSLSEVCGMYHAEPGNIFLLGPVSSVSVFFFFTVTVTLTLFLSSVHPPKPQETQCHRGRRSLNHIS